MSDEEEEIVETPDTTSDDYLGRIALEWPLELLDEVWLVITPLAGTRGDITGWRSESSAKGFVGNRLHRVIRGPYKYMGQRGLFG